MAPYEVMLGRLQPAAFLNLYCYRVLGPDWTAIMAEENRRKGNKEGGGHWGRGIQTHMFICIVMCGEGWGDGCATSPAPEERSPE